MQKELLLKKLMVLAAFVWLPSGLFARPAAEAPGTMAHGVPLTMAPLEQEPIEAYFFYEEPFSQDLTDEERFAAILQEKLPPAERDQYPHSFSLVNVSTDSGRQDYIRVTDGMGLDRTALYLPLLVLGGRVFQGYNSISANIREAYLTAAEDLYLNKRPYNPRFRKTGESLFEDYPVNPDHVSLVYYYRLTCSWCAKTTPLIDALPETIMTAGGERPVDVIRINTRSGNNGERIDAFFDEWEVPEGDRIVPIVFFSNSYLAGYDAISARLLERLGGEPGTWPLLPVEE